MRKGTRLILAIVLILTLPSAAALLRYAQTKDPTFRPLGITFEALQHWPSNKGAEIVVQIYHDGQTSSRSVRRFASAIRNSFATKGVACRIITNQHAGPGIQVYYIVGPTRIGPLRPNEASSHVNAAVQAFHMTTLSLQTLLD